MERSFKGLIEQGQLLGFCLVGLASADGELRSLRDSFTRQEYQSAIGVQVERWQ